MIYFYTIGDRKVASSRMRVWHVVDRIEGGTLVTVVHQDASLYERFRTSIQLLGRIVTTSSSDCFYIHKISASRSILLLCVVAVLMGRRVIYDFDDERSGRLVRLLIRRATEVVVSSHELEKDARLENECVVVLPTSVPLDIYATKKVISGDSVVVGWIGSAKGQLESLEILVPVFEELAHRGVLCTFRLIGAEGIGMVHEMFRKIGKINVEIVDSLSWDDEAKVAEAVRGFDIGVMPLVDSRRAQRKAGFKLIQYMAVGLPVIASKVGENVYIVEDAKSGFLVTSTKEWADALEGLIKNKEQRSRMGAEGRRIVESRYSLEGLMPQYKRIFYGK